MDSSSQQVPTNLVEHMKILLSNCEYEDNVPDMFVELFYQFVDSTISTAHQLNLLRCRTDPSLDPNELLHEQIFDSEKIFFNLYQIIPTASRTDKAEEINKQPIDTKNDFDIEVAVPPPDATLEEINFQIPIDKKGR